MEKLLIELGWNASSGTLAGLKGKMSHALTLALTFSAVNATCQALFRSPQNVVLDTIVPGF